MIFRKFFGRDRDGLEPFPRFDGVHFPSLRRAGSWRSSIAPSGESEASSSTSRTDLPRKKTFAEHFRSRTKTGSSLSKEHGNLAMPAKGKRPKSTQSAVSLNGLRKGFWTGSSPSVQSRNPPGYPRPYSIADSTSLMSEPTSPTSLMHPLEIIEAREPLVLPEIQQVVMEKPALAVVIPPPVEEEGEISHLLEAVEDRLKKLNHGAVSITMVQEGYAYLYSTTLLGRREPSGSGAHLTHHLHPCFLAMYADEIPGLQRIEELDVEVGRQFEGSHPGTVGIGGLGWEIWDAADRAQPRTQTVYYSMAPIPDAPGPEIIKRLNLLATQGLSSPQVEGKSLLKFIGHSTAAFFDAENPLYSQIGDLLRVLNREDKFEDFSLVGSPYLLAMAAPPDGVGPRAFLFQILLGYELLLRLHQTTGTSFPGITQQINSNLIMSNRWVKNVNSELQNSALKTTSKISDSQIEGLLFFGDHLQWPLMEEVRKFVQDVCARHLAGERIDSNFIDFLYGITLPGRFYAHKLMTALLYASPSIRRYGTTHYYDAGLVLEGSSYWRSRTPLGRVMGGLSSVKAVAGWVGPCPPVSVLDGHSIEGWITVRGKPIPFKVVHGIHHDEHTEDDHHADRGLRLRPGETPRDLLRELSDMTKWQSPSPPKESVDIATVEQLRLSHIYSDEEEDEHLRQAEASLSFSINGELVDFTLTYAPVFVSAPSCENGPHLAHTRELGRYQQIVEVRDLKKTKHPEEGIIVINATGPGGDVVARAWCAEVGRHALIRRGDTTCLTCALNTAENIHLDVLIWS